MRDQQVTISNVSNNAWEALTPEACKIARPTRAAVCAVVTTGLATTSAFQTLSSSTPFIQTTLQVLLMGAGVFVSYKNYKATNDMMTRLQPSEEKPKKLLTKIKDATTSRFNRMLVKTSLTGSAVVTAKTLWAVYKDTQSIPAGLIAVFSLWASIILPARSTNDWLALKGKLSSTPAPQ